MDPKETTPLVEGLKKVGEDVKAIGGTVATIADEQAAIQQTVKSLETKVDGMDVTPKITEMQKSIDALAVKVNTPNLNTPDNGKKKSEYGSKFKSMDDFYRAVKYACSGKGEVVESAKALQGNTATGSYLVPTEFVPTVIDTLPKYENLVDQAFRLPWGDKGNTRNIPNLAQLPTAYFVDEAGTKTASAPSFSLLNQMLKVLEVMVVLTNQLMNDAGINLAAFLPEWARRAIMNTWLKAMFLGDTTSATNPVIGINTASGVLTPTVPNVSSLFALKSAVPAQIRATGKYYMDRAVYDQILALLITTKPTGYAYDAVQGKLTIDGSPVVALDASIVGAGNVFFGDLSTIIFSPKNELYVRWSDQASVTDEKGDLVSLFQKNMQAFLFESRADLTVVGSVWAKAHIA